MVMSVYQLEEFLEKASKRLGSDHMRFVVTQGEDPQTVEIEVTCSYDSVFIVDWFLDDGALDDLPKSLYLEAASCNDADYGYEVAEDAEELQWFAEKLQGLISGDDWDLNDFLGKEDEDSGDNVGHRVVRVYIPKNVRVEIVTHDKDSVEVTME